MSQYFSLTVGLQSQQSIYVTVNNTTYRKIQF